jgi:nucleoside-diphosphate-sugar epimerase
MRVLITGGTGYVGRYAADRCVARGWQVHLLTRPGSSLPALLEGRVTRHDTDGAYAALCAVLDAVRPDCVLHLASAPTGAHSPELVEQLIDANIRFPTRLLEAMLTTNVRYFVNTGTFWQHYAGSAYWPVDFYAAAKQAFEDLLRHYTDLHGVAAITLKLYDNYGLDDPRRKIVTGLVDAARAGRSLDMSAGEQILDLTHVEDLGTAFAIAAERVRAATEGSNETFFVSGERMPLKALAALIAASSQTGLDVKLGARAYRVREIMEPITGEPLPGWQRKHGVEATIRQMLQEN